MIIIRRRRGEYRWIVLLDLGAISQLLKLAKCCDTAPLNVTQFHAIHTYTLLFLGIVQ